MAAKTEKLASPPGNLLEQQRKPEARDGYNTARVRTPSPSRSFRLLWLVPVLILLGTLIGARYLLNGSRSGEDGDDKQPASGNVLAQGRVDVEGGVAILLPGQQGRVFWVIKEGQEVKEGEVLLRLDQEQTLAKEDQAKAALRNAEALLTEAEALYQQHKQWRSFRGKYVPGPLVKQQEAAVAVATHTLTIAEAKKNRAEEAFKNESISKHDLNEATANWEKAKAGLQAEKEKLRSLEMARVDLKIAQAQANVQAKQGQLREARKAVQECEVRAPAPGFVLRVQISVGESLTAQTKVPPIQFCPNHALVYFSRFVEETASFPAAAVLGQDFLRQHLPKPRIIRAEVLQEWADRVEAGQEVLIEDDTRTGNKWTGRVRKVSDWFTPKRDPANEPFTFNDVRTLECLIDVHPGGRPLRVGQRVRVTIKTDK